MLLATILRICAAAYFLAIIIELALTRQFKHFLLELAAGVVVIGLALLMTNASTGRIAFGEGISPVGGIALMFIMTMGGILAQYIFYLQPGQFSWLDFPKSLVITPILLLPLSGSIQGVGNLNAVQSISFALLAFQNSFFWQAVLAKAQPTTQE